MPTRSKDVNRNGQNEENIAKPLPVPSTHDDGGASLTITGDDILKGITDRNGLTNSSMIKAAMHGANIFERNEVKNALYNKTFRFGLSNPYGAIATAREYLFFTRPDLHILPMDDNGVVISSGELNSTLADIPFWVDLFNTRKDTTLKSLQLSVGSADPFNHLLQNQVISNLDVPALNSEMIDTPTNMYGVGYSYRGSSEASDDNPEFSLEFKDTRYLDTYMFFKAYEEYETLKHHGVISPSKYYTVNKILHDQFAIYKFIVDEDMETIIYYGKMYGVVPKSLPRDVFSNPNFDNGISYSVDFRAAFYEDMRPDIIADFNKLSLPYYNAQPYQITPHNRILDHADMRPAKAAYIIKETDTEAAKASPVGYVYKLKWRGDDIV